ncbi:hypothetical protein PCANC_22574 [Puccinia coronata f. sp. avenae]|uniref:Uncharacterized protein n=1 Tax=Puccinia coronata f. sp. avenae TaxID=200324 RepID=A0A2N5UN48_9BASI|nr:hypothetical protein PCANC_22574 [Puccinia coronata f. sp. avenae]PLW41989.1 hypothetical protein PCASD_10091 [Puccinia coronata f. sp. avenae]
MRLPSTPRNLPALPVAHRLLPVPPYLAYCPLKACHCLGQPSSKNPSLESL